MFDIFISFVVQFMIFRDFAKITMEIALHFVSISSLLNKLST